MRAIRPYKPAPKNASANRIRERYLHQLGLQRGGAPLTAPHLSNNHVVVISGLPSLPEDRATTTEHVMESHDFSISKHSQHTGASSGEHDDMDSDSGSACCRDVHSICSKSTLSASPSMGKEADESITSMALAPPTALRKVPPSIPPLNNNINTMLTWRPSLSKPATVLLDSADHDSVSSGGTSTTAESSLTAAMVSRDWGAVPHTTASAAVSVSSQGGESPASAPGVYFQCGHPRLLVGNVPSSSHCATASLASALNRFNIDSDCEASIASNSIVDDHNMMDEDDVSIDDTASRASVTSHTSTGSSKIQMRAQRKKIGKTQRLMDRAAAHDRIIQIRCNQSQKMRANVVNTQRMGGSINHQVVSISGLSSAMAQEAQPQLSQSPCSTTGSQESILMHVKHATPKPSVQQPLHLSDLGRTPTASNCSDLRRLKSLRYPSHLADLPAGVHINQEGPGMPLPNYQDAAGASSRMMAPLNFHPQLACQLPTPPPKLGGVIGIPNTNSQTNSAQELQPAQVESREAEESTTSSLEHMNHPASVDDVMEVALTLSKLGGGRTGSIPRFR